MGIFGPKGARLVFSCVSAVGATKFAPQADWDLQYSADALTAEELRSHRLSPASVLSTPADEMKRRNKKNPNDIQVPVFYATNREPLSSAERQRHPRKFFGQVGKTSPGLNLGLARVRIREDAFKLANLQDERDARRLEEISQCKDEAEWKKKLREALNGDVKKSIIVFVHGCFTDFPRGLEYGGLVKHGCDFSGPMIVFSWPSIGHKVQSRPYAKDEKSVKWTVPQLKEFLHMLLTEFEAKVHVLSYSMGARAVVGALDLLEEEVLALDEKLKKDGSQLRAALQDKLRSVVTRGEEAAAGMKVGVRELGNILVRERDLLKEKAASLRSQPLTLHNEPNLNPSADLGYDQGRVAGYGEGSALNGGAGEAMSSSIGATEAGSGPGLGLTAAGSRVGVSEERVREWEAMRAKLGHLIFMAPDEEVERFRHTARRWTQSLRDRVSGRTQGASEEVKERVRTDLEADGPQAIEEAAKRGGTRSGDVTLAGKVAGLSVDIPRFTSSPAVLQNGGNSVNTRSMPSALDLALTSSVVSVTPPFSAWQNVLGSDGLESGEGADSGQEEGLAKTQEGGGAKSPLMVSPSRLATIFSGKALDLNPRNLVKPVSDLTPDQSQNLPHASISETPALSLPKVQSTPVIYPTEADSPLHDDVGVPSPGVTPPADDVFPMVPDVISPGVSERAFSAYPRSFQGNFRPSSPSASSTSSRTFSRSSSSTDLVGEELQQALLWEHLHAAALDGDSDRSSEASSRASSRAPSRKNSLADLGSNSSSFNESGPPDELLSTAGGRQLTAGGSGLTSPGSAGMREGAGGVTAGVSPEVTAGAGGVTAGKAGEKAMWRRKSLPAMGLHLSSSAPILTPGSLEWRFLHRPTAERHVATSESSTPPSAPDVSTSDDDVSMTGPRFSLYTSQSDWALKLAGLATTKPWARGLARMVAFGNPGKNDLGRRVGAVLLVEEGYETIDATEVSIGSRNMGHHYLFHRCILEDITHLLSGANAHKRRFEATTPDGKVYWKIERGDYKPAVAPSPALYPTWSTVHMMEGTKVAPAERQLLFFTSDEAAINFNY